MKKILTVSLFAIMAVSAANAEIASTRYVTDRTGNTTFTGSVADSADLTVAVNALATKVDTVAGSGTGSVADQITEALTPVSNQVTENKNAIAALDSTYATDTALTNGLALKEDVANKTSTIDHQSTATQYPTAAAVYTFVDTVRSEIADGNGEALAGINQTIAANKSAADTGIAEAKTAAANALADAKTYADQKDTAQTTAITNAYQQYADQAEADALAAAKTYADTEDKKIEDTIGEVESGKTVVQMITAAKNAASTGATEALDAYKELNNAAVEAAQTQADKGVADAAKAQQQADKGVADAAAAQAAANKAQGEVDDLEGVVAQQKTDLEAYADQAEADAIAAAKTAGDAAYAVKSTETVASGNATAIQTINTNMGPLAGVKIPAACATGRCALVMENNQAKWEVINY